MGAPSETVDWNTPRTSLGEGITVTVPRHEVGARVGFARGDGHGHNLAGVGDCVAADDGARRVTRVGDLILDDRVTLVAQVAGPGLRVPAVYSRIWVRWPSPR